jgi:glutamate carboxypeptidase
MDPYDILHHFQARQDEIERSIGELVEVESPSGDIEGSRAAASWVEARASRLGLEAERIGAEGVGEHVIVRAFAGAEPNLLVLGHTDTVHPAGARAQNPTRIEDGRFYGCGIFDMKANIALIFEALEYLQAAGIEPERPITLLLSCDEEIGSFTGRPLVEREAARASACLVLEPSARGRVKTGRKGTGMFTLKVRGIPAHAGLEPERGASAVLEIARQVEKLHGLNDPSAGTTVNVCTIRGGTTSNVIPATAECSVDVRFSTIAEAERIERSIHELLPFDGRVSLDISGGVNRPPMERSEAVLGLYRKARELAASFGYELAETQVGGASDGNFVAAMGVPLLDGLGVAGDGAHTLSEYIVAEDIAHRATLLTLLLAVSPDT